MTGLFPRAIGVETTYLNHASGSKDYYVRVLSVGNRSVVAFAWGKVRGKKQTDVSAHESKAIADNVAADKIDAKLKRGYSKTQPNRTLEAATLGGLEGIVGNEVMRELESCVVLGDSQTYLEWLLEAAGAPAGAKVSRAGRRAAVEDGMDPEGAIERAKRLREEAALRVELKRWERYVEDERLALEKAEREAFYANNSSYGMF